MEEFEEAILSGENGISGTLDSRINCDGYFSGGEWVWSCLHFSGTDYLLSLMSENITTARSGRLTVYIFRLHMAFFLWVAAQIQR